MSQEPLFEIEDVLVKTYDNRTFQIRSFQTFPGVNYGISGKGADLMMQVMALMHPPIKGKMTLKGELLRPWKKASRYRGEITYVGDEIRLFRGTVEDNIRLPLLWKGLKEDQIEAREEELNEELGWGFLYKKPVGQLSAEEYRMAQYIRALALEPEVIVIHNLSAHLSRNNMQRFEEFLNKHFRMGRSVIFSSSVRAHYERLAHVLVTVRNEYITKVRSLQQPHKDDRRRTRSEFKDYRKGRSRENGIDYFKSD